MIKDKKLTFSIKNPLTIIANARYNLEKRGEITLKLKRLQKTSYFLHIALKLLSISSIIILVLSVMMKLRKNNSSNFSITTPNENGSIGFNFQTSFFPGVDTGQYDETEQWIMLGFAALSLLLLAFLLWVASIIFKSLAVEFAPFSDIQVSRLRLVAQLLLIYALVPQILYSIFHTILIPGYSISLSLDMSFFFAIIFYCLTEIFRYGAVLQKESDETL